eukprot:1747785-Amphidinium_carterae.1
MLVLFTAEGVNDTSSEQTVGQVEIPVRHIQTHLRGLKTQLGESQSKARTHRMFGSTITALPISRQLSCPADKGKWQNHLPRDPVHVSPDAGRGKELLAATSSKGEKIWEQWVGARHCSHSATLHHPSLALYLKDCALPGKTLLSLCVASKGGSYQPRVTNLHGLCSPQLVKKLCCSPDSPRGFLTDLRKLPDLGSNGYHKIIVDGVIQQADSILWQTTPLERFMTLRLAGLTLFNLVSTTSRLLQAPSTCGPLEEAEECG